MKIMIIGVGGIGSFLVPLLSKAGHKLHIYDFDRIEEKNILGLVTSFYSFVCLLT